MHKPKCPSHPSASVLAARKPGEDRKQWICLECGAALGDAGPRNDEWETFTIGEQDAQQGTDDAGGTRQADGGDIPRVHTEDPR